MTSPGGRKPAVPISIALVDHLRDTATRVIRGASPIFSDGYLEADQQWESWVQAQPGARRSPIRVLAGEARLVGWAAWMNGVDHLESIVDLMHIRPGEFPRVWSYLTLSRVAVEAFVRAAYYSERSVAPHDQSLRQAAGVLSGLQEQMTLAREHGDTNTMAQCSRELDKAAAKIRRAGVTINYNGNRAVNVEREGARRNVELNVSEETAKRLQGIPEAYRMGSAVAHSGLWFLGDAFRAGADGEVDMFPDPDLMIAAVAGACEAAVEGATAIGRTSQAARSQELGVRFRRDVARAVALRRG